MQANTKLDQYQKEALKIMKVNLPDVKVLNLDNKTTIAFKRLGNTVEFALSVMAPTEKKFRRKVGEYWALAKFENCETVKMDADDFLTMCENVWSHYPF